MMRGQSLYGRSIARANHGPISIGRNLYPTVREDEFDRGPLARHQFALVADVRIDNRDELAEAMNIPQARVRTMSDSEVLFDCLIAWGEKAPSRLVGEFAFAFWNGSDGSLLLARDLLGLRPLYYSRSDRFFAFSTMPSGLHSLPHIPYEFDAEFMAENLALLPHRGTRTFYRAIERIEPATVVRVQRKAIVADRYWHPPQYAKRLPAAEFEEGLRDVVEASVRSQVRGAQDGVASHLSGGLDSSIVTVTAARILAPKPVVAFTARPRKGFAGPTPTRLVADESELASQTAQLYRNIEHVFVERSADSPLQALDRNHAYFQQPSVNPDNDVWARQINRMVRERGLKVLLVGLFGNISISYSGMECLPWLLANGHPFKALNAARHIAAFGVGWRGSAVRLFASFLPDPLWRVACRLKGRPTDLRDYCAIKRRLLPQIEAEAAEQNFDLLYRGYRDPMAFRLMDMFRTDIGNYGKGVLAEFGLSVRDPTADRRVIDFCLSVPPEEYIRGGVTRSLARRAFRDHLPSSVAQLPIRGYQSADWYEAIQDDFSSFTDEAAAIERCAAAGTAMDVDWLKETVATWPKDGWAREDVILRYRCGLLRAVQAGHFMRKVAGTN